jgi:hypothetical protein
MSAELATKSPQVRLFPGVTQTSAESLEVHSVWPGLDKPVKRECMDDDGVAVGGVGAAGCARLVWEGRRMQRRVCPLCRREVRAVVRIVNRDGNVVRDSDATPPTFLTY